MNSRAPGFYQIDNRILQVFGPRMGPYGIAVYNALAMHANRHGECHPSYETIAAETGMSARQAKREIEKLCGLKLVAIRDSSKGRVNHYQLTNLASTHDTESLLGGEPMTGSHDTQSWVNGEPMTHSHTTHDRESQGSDTQSLEPMTHSHTNNTQRTKPTRQDPIEQSFSVNGTGPHSPSAEVDIYHQAFADMVAELRSAQRDTNKQHWSDMLVYGGCEEAPDGLSMLIFVPDPSWVEWIETRCKRQIRQSLRVGLGKPVHVQFSEE